MAPYLRLRGWPEFVGLVAIGLVLQFLDQVSIPQPFGPELRYPLFLFNLTPIVATGSLMALLGSRWDERYELATTARPTASARILVVVAHAAAWAGLFSGGIASGVVPAHSALVATTSAGCSGLALAVVRRLGVGTAAKVLLPVSAFACMYPWIIGDATFLGDSLGYGRAFAGSVTMILLYVCGAAFWVHGGRRDADPSPDTISDV